MSLLNPQEVPAYPPIRYTKDRPEASAWVRRGDAAPDYEARARDSQSYLATQVKYHYLASQEQTGGDYALYRVERGPNAGGPAPHSDEPASMLMLFAPGAPRNYFFRSTMSGCSFLWLAAANRCDPIWSLLSAGIRKLATNTSSSN